MEKKCYICGRTINPHELYYTAGPNSYVCNQNDCYEKHFWDMLAARMAVDNEHQYVIIDNKVYEIGSEYDEPLGFGGKHWNIQFDDGILKETNSLWFRGDLPERLQRDFPDNAKFIAYD